MPKTKKLKSYTIAEARDRFTEVVREAESRQAIEVTRRGQPVAMIVSIAEYQLFSGENPRSSKSFLEIVEDLRASPDFEPIENPEEVFRRDPATDSDRPDPWQ